MSALADEIKAAVADSLAPLRADLERMTAELTALKQAVPPSLVPLKEAARRMGVSVKTATRRCQSGDWPSRRDGGRVLVDLSGLRPKTGEEIARAAFNLRALPGGNDGAP